MGEQTQQTQPQQPQQPKRGRPTIGKKPMTAAERVRRSRAKNNVPDHEKAWEKNWRALSEAKRETINDAIEEWNYIFHMMYVTCTRIGENAVYGVAAKEGDVLFMPEQLLFEVEEFARKHPPILVRDLDAHLRFKENDGGHSDVPLEACGPLFQKFGIPIDGICVVTYYGFLRSFGVWYKANRNTLTLATVDMFGDPCHTWDEVDSLMLKNERLKHLVGIMRLHSERQNDPVPEPQAIESPVEPPPDPQPTPRRPSVNTGWQRT